jgi:hypothetical protein
MFDNCPLGSFLNGIVDLSKIDENDLLREKDGDI